RTLARSPLANRLTTLNLRGLGIGPEGMMALTASRCLTRVKSLELSYNSIGDRGIRLLASSAIGRLRCLSLAHCEITPKGGAILAGASNLRRLQMLILEGNALDSSVAAALASSPHLEQLVCLDLCDNQIDDRGALALAAYHFLPRLR